MLSSDDNGLGFFLGLVEGGLLQIIEFTKVFLSKIWEPEIWLLPLVTMSLRWLINMGKEAPNVRACSLQTSHIRI